MQKILESKAVKRRQLAALPFSEKVKLLEQLRDRALAIANSPLKQTKYPSHRAATAALHDKPMKHKNKQRA